MARAHPAVAAVICLLGAACAGARKPSSPQPQRSAPLAQIDWWDASTAFERSDGAKLQLSGPIVHLATPGSAPGAAAVETMPFRCALLATGATLAKWVPDRLEGEGFDQTMMLGWRERVAHHSVFGGGEVVARDVCVETLGQGWRVPKRSDLGSLVSAAPTPFDWRNGVFALGDDGSLGCMRAETVCAGGPGAGGGMLMCYSGPAKWQATCPRAQLRCLRDGWQLEGKHEVPIAEIRACIERVARLLPVEKNTTNEFTFLDHHGGAPALIAPLLDLALAVEAACRGPTSDTKFSDLVAEVERITGGVPIEEAAERLERRADELKRIDLLLDRSTISGIDCAKVPGEYARKCAQQRLYSSCVRLQIHYAVGCRRVPLERVESLFEKTRASAQQLVTDIARQLQRLTAVGRIAPALAHCIRADSSLSDTTRAELRKRIDPLLLGVKRGYWSDDCDCALGELGKVLDCLVAPAGCRAGPSKAAPNIPR